MDDAFRIDGREFQPVSQNLTASQDDYLLAYLRLAGAVEVLTDADGKQREPGKRAEELLTQILLSGRSHHILAGCLTETGKKWTREEADRNAAIFAEITDPAEKGAIRTAIVGFVLSFFSFGEKSPATSRKSSSRKETGRPTGSAAAATSGTSRP